MLIDTATRDEFFKNALSVLENKLRSSIRFECELPDDALQNKIFQFPQDSSLGLGDYYVNARRYLMSSVSTVNNSGYKTFITNKINYSGLIHPCYIDSNGDKVEYSVRFMSGYMAVIRKVEDGKENNSS